MPATYEPISTTTLSTTTATVTFSGITGTYTDLILVASFGAVSANNDVRLEINSDSGANYSATTLTGTGTTGTSVRVTNYSMIPAYYSIGCSTDPQIITINFMNYSNTTTRKTVLSRVSSAGKELSVVAGYWRNTAAITSFSLTNIGNATPAGFTSGSVFTLYGIKAA